MSIDSQPDAILWVRLPQSLHARLKVEAEVHHRSMSGQVRWLIEQSLPGDQAEAAAA